tara:strand:+ start:1487 stop:1849 length:363 start_codon:yes stop_codon:yes gene_type:complete
MKGVVKIKNMRVYAFHGCLKEESKIGGDYLINLRAFCDLARAANSDKIEETANYTLLAKIISKEMSVRSDLLESVAKRIVDSCIKEISVVDRVVVEISKVNPPINADVESVVVVLEGKRQ